MALDTIDSAVAAKPMVYPLDHQVARSLDAPVELIPYLPELLADFDELGSSLEAVCKSVEPLGLSYRSRVLDLGCGKGPAGVMLAQRYACRVKGIDAFEPFVAAARRLAIEHGVAHLCEFHHADLREAARLETDYDLVMLLAVGSVLGDQQATIRALRTCVNVGGHILLDDAYLLDPKDTCPECAGYAGLDETVARLTAHGDRIVSQRIFTPAEAESVNVRNTAFIEARAKSLAVAQPELADLLGEYVAEQRRASEVLERHLGGALWLIEVR